MLFPSRGFLLLRCITYTAARGMVKKAGAMVGVHLRPHDLRRHAVLEPGGTLFLTLDNLADPIIVLRQILPFLLPHGLGLVPYFVGKTLGPARWPTRFITGHFVAARAVMHPTEKKRGNIDE